MKTIAKMNAKPEININLYTNALLLTTINPSNNDTTPINNAKILIARLIMSG
ncbi:MAG: hypothetical protein Phog2KO_05850 [Phototrophicaceae bacterium]